MSKKRHEHHEEHADESWLLPYSDLMTLLLALFIVLYASSSVNISKLEALSQAFKSALSSGLGVLDGGSVTDDSMQRRLTDDTQNRSNDGRKNKSRAVLQQEEQENLEKLKENLDQYIAKNGLSTQLETQLNQSQLLITIRDNALFASGSATIKPDSQKLAAAIGTMLEQYPDYEVQVKGHTDNQPINTAEFPSNYELSSKRAINFMKILLQNEAFDPKQFSATGYAEFHPLKSNATEAGRAVNRRVEVSILRHYTEPMTEDQKISVAAKANGTQQSASQ